MAQPVTVEAPQSIGLGIVFLRGQIKSRRRTKRGGVDGVASVLVLPAPDAYSHPATVEVFSPGPDPLGQVGAEVSVKCRVGGFGRTYDKKEEDGEGYVQRVTVQTADVTLTVIA